MTIPTIGFGKDAGVRIDLAALLERRLLIQAASGAGKSTLVRALAEQLVGQVQQWVIDREGDFVTLREVGDFVLVGRGGDVPADRKSVKLLARRLMELGASAVFDLSELRMHEQREYVRLLFEELTHMPRALWHPLMVWLDEGHFFAPQAEKCVSTQAVADGASVWRKRGYCLAVATQRLSKLDKDVAAELHNKFIGFTDDVDLRRAGDQLGMTTEQRAELQQLEPGVFYAYGPAISRTRVLVRGPKPKTAPPAKGEARSVAPAPPEKVRAILAKLVDLAKEAEEEQRTTEDLRRAVAERDRKIRQLEKGGVVQTVEKPVVDQAVIAREVQRAVQATTRANAQSINALRKALEAAMKFIINVSTQNFDVAGVNKEELERAIGAAVMKATDMVERRLVARQQQIDSLRLAAGRIVEQLKAALGDEETVISVEVAKNEPFTVSAQPRPEAKRARVIPVVTGDGVSLPVGERATLIACAQYPDGADRTQISILTQYKRSSRDAYISRLLAKGFVEVRGGTVIATDDGIAALGSDFEPLPTGEALRDHWLSVLPEGERRVLEVLLAAYPETVGRQSIDEETGYKRSSRDAYLSRLGARKLVTTSSDGVRASAILFEEG